MLINSRFKMIVCDMAGTIIKENNIVYKTLYEVIKSFNNSLLQEDINKFKGFNKLEVIDHFVKKQELPFRETRLLIKQSNNYTGFGPVIYDDSNHTFYRIFRPFMPEKNHNGEYLSGKDSGCKILLKDEQGLIREYELPRGVFFIPEQWEFNPNTNELGYVTIYIKNRQDENRYFQTYTFNPYYFH